MESMDENSFFALLDDPNGTTEFNDDDLVAYLSSNMSEYDIYLETDSNN